MNLQDALTYFGLSAVGDVSMAELKSIYRRLAKEKHPDQGGTNLEFVNLRKSFVLLKNELEKNTSTPKKSTIITQEVAELNKDELLARYYKDTEKLQNQLQLYEKTMGDQQIILSSLKDKVKEIVNSFNSKKDSLQTSVKLDIQALENKLNKQVFWRRIFFFWPSMSQSEFWSEYNKKIQYYTSLNSDLDSQFFKDMLNTYGEGLNGLQQHIPENNETNT